MPYPRLNLEPSEFAARREALRHQMQPNSALIMPAGYEKPRSRDTHYHFRPDSDFIYLTGFTEPEAWLMLLNTASPQAVIFCRPKDKQKEIWDGYRLGVDQAAAALNLDQAYSIEQLDKKVPDLLENIDALYFPMTRYDWLNQAVVKWVKSVKARARKGVNAPACWIDSDTLIHEMRLIKSDSEIQMMRSVCEISAQAHVQAMQSCTPGMFEYQLEALYQAAFLHAGCTGHAYPSIVGSGANACVLHYIDNKDPLCDGDLVLVDAGGELDYYAGDITRTYPINGQFTQVQKQLYQIVLDAQRSAIDVVKPGQSFDAPHQAALRSLTQSLIDLGWIEGPLAQAIEKKHYEPFYMHKTGHWLGLDVHDVGRYKQDGQWRTLEPGMILTVEPGLYVAADQSQAPAQYRGIGIRIEDDVLVTPSGCEVLTASVPKTISEIEVLMRKY